jgi:hypothetical protein
MGAFTGRSYATVKQTVSGDVLSTGTVVVLLVVAASQQRERVHTQHEQHAKQTEASRWLGLTTSSPFVLMILARSSVASLKLDSSLSDRASSWAVSLAL